MYIILHLLHTPIKACLSLILFLSDCVCTYVCIYHVYIDCNYNNFHKKYKVFIKVFKNTNTFAMYLNSNTNTCEKN